MQPQVAISSDFLKALAELPRAQQKKVREFTEKFRRDPTQPGINFERIEQAVDPKVRSVRIDQAYRAIVVHPPRGDVYLLVWVAHHDDAYRWAQGRRFEVHPRSGALQIYAAVEDAETSRPAEPPAPAPAEEALLAAVDDEDLLLAGVPSPLLASVRALRSEDDLDALAPHLPEDAAEMLYFLAAGFSLIEATLEADRSQPAPEIDTEDFGAALERPESRRKFRIPEDEKELAAMLEAPLEQWRTFLHPSQRRLVEMNANGPVRVLGGAGTGKTVVLMHRARHLARSVFSGAGERILVTTYTRNLALDLRANLCNLCGEEFERLEVTNLHSWAVAFLRRHGFELNILQDEDTRLGLFEQAMDESGAGEGLLGGISASFYRDEWDRIVQAQDVDSRDAYLTARRTGRGVRLGRKQKVEVWKVLKRYRELLVERKQVEWEDVLRETRLYIEKQQLDPGLAAVLADEVQDLTVNGLELLRTLAPQAPNTLFLVGDGHQRIYGQSVPLSRCGIDIRGRSRRLKLNYRTTAQIRNYAVAVLEGREIDDLDEGVDTLKGYHSLRQGPKPQIRHSSREAEEAQQIIETLEAWLTESPAESICITARTKQQLRNRYQRLLEAQGIPCCMVETDPEKEAQKPGVRLATMHRLKGLEFPRVLIAGVHAGSVPLPTNGFPDPASQQDHELQERCLFYVATTRARDELVVTGYGERSPFLR